MFMLHPDDELDGDAHAHTNTASVLSFLHLHNYLSAVSSTALILVSLAGSTPRRGRGGRAGEEEENQRDARKGEEKGDRFREVDDGGRGSGGGGWGAPVGHFLSFFI